ncbi:MAG TPA: 2-amino-4-hydroxy-6-hydroxymethyldihydropteridine diphosphokinase [Puia sp.]|nr:2-amino-4-hydroxy-6-hydroxymethyldihydropteridine diphosphokinase [Puia sp.]
MNKVYLLMGGNEGNSHAYLEEAAANIRRQCGEIMQRSSVYVTAAWGKKDQPDFLNQALLLYTLLDPPALLATLLNIEEKMGRKRREKFGPRVIDIDILFFNQSVVDLPQLKIPHPEIQHRRFALTPMAELAPDLEHPVLHKTIRQLLLECGDPLNVKKI